MLFGKKIEVSAEAFTSLVDEVASLRRARDEDKLALEALKCELGDLPPIRRARRARDAAAKWAVSEAKLKKIKEDKSASRVAECRDAAAAPGNAFSRLTALDGAGVMLDNEIGLSSVDGAEMMRSHGSFSRVRCQRSTVLRDARLQRILVEDPHVKHAIAAGALAVVEVPIDEVARSLASLGARSPYAEILPP